jgi:hypothetical protein
MGNGTLEEPFYTLQKAVDSVEALYDDFVICVGQYLCFS